MKSELLVLSTQRKQVCVDRDYSPKTKTKHFSGQGFSFTACRWRLVPKSRVHVLLQPPHPRKSPSTTGHSCGRGRTSATPLPSTPRPHAGARAPDLVRDTTRQIPRGPGYLPGGLQLGGGHPTCPPGPRAQQPGLRLVLNSTLCTNYFIN